MRSIDNARRGCGHLVKGGFYARGDRFTRTGALASWTWALGDMVDVGHNLLLEAPPRTQTLINLPASLARGEVVTNMEPTAEMALWPALQSLPTVAVLDHVGRDYTPYSFAMECQARGPNRRITADAARIIATLAPVPVIFTHAWMPLPDEGLAVQWYDTAIGLNYGNPNRPARLGPVFDDPNWGVRSIDGRGADHWSIPVLHMLSDMAEGRPKPLSAFLQPPASSTYLAEQAFGISWFTGSIYVTQGTETPDELQAIRMSGIEPVVAQSETVSLR